MELQRTHRARKEHPMLPKEKQMDVLEAYDLTQSLRAAAELTGIRRRYCLHADHYPGEAWLCTSRCRRRA